MTLLPADGVLDSQSSTSVRRITAQRLHDKFHHNLDCLNVGYDRVVRLDFMEAPTDHDKKIRPFLDAVWDIHNEVRSHVRWEQPLCGLGSLTLYTAATNATTGTIEIPQKNLASDSAFYTVLLKASAQTFDELAVKKTQLITPAENIDWLQTMGWLQKGRETRFLTTRSGNALLQLATPPSKGTYTPRRAFHECGQ